MLSKAGHLALVLALGFAVFQFLCPLVGGLKSDHRWRRLAQLSARWQFGFMTVAFVTLIVAYLTCDFSLVNVFLNAHTKMPVLYRFAGAWGNHEGSLLLWVWILSLMGLGMSYLKHPQSLVQGALSCQGLLTCLFILLLLWAADPFVQLPFTPAEGQALNPLLQDRGLALHPPLLYLGYVGFSAVFSFSIAGLWQKKVDSEWALAVRPWALMAWAGLTLGIALGSWWAYYELGWGGYWFWDPVENASLMPWLAGTALIHTLRVMEVKDQLRRWTVLLALLTFAFSLLGTFLVRSGLISSVHTFASDPHRGIIILSLMAFLVGGAFLLYALRMPGASGTQASLNFGSREGFMTLNSLLLFVGLMTVTWGTLYPLMLEAVTGKVVSVGAPYFNMTVLPILLPLLVLAPIGIELTWGHGSFKLAFEKALYTFTPSIAVGVIVLYVIDPGPVMSMAAASLALWLITSSLYYGLRHRHISRLSMIFGHVGVGVMVLGIAISTAWQEEKSAMLTVGETVSLGDYAYHLEDVQRGKGPNYTYERAQLKVTKQGKSVTTLMPEQRVYMPQELAQTETAIYTNGFENLYAILGPQRGENVWPVKVFYHPLVPWIWWGGALMAIGAILALGRRMRVK